MPEQHNDEFWGHLDRLIQNSQVVIDRPKDSAHIDHEDMIYPLDYGYLAGTTSSDGAGIDVWLGSSGEHHVHGVVCTVDLFKRDAEIKLLLGCTDDEMQTIVSFLNQNQGMRCYLLRRNGS